MARKDLDPRHTPSTAQALLQQAIAHHGAGRHAEALQLCRRLLAAAPERADLLGFAAQIVLEMGDLAEAASLYQASVARKPDFVEAHYNLGNILMRLKRPEEAAAAYRSAARLRPDLVVAHNNLGNALQALGRLEEAAGAYRRALARAPGAAEPQRNLGIVLHGMGKLEEATTAFRRAVALKPDWPAALRNLANTLLERGEAQATVETCDAWLRLEPGKIEALSLKALALTALGDREGARFLVDFDRFLEVIEFRTPPAGYADMADFNAALTRHALGHPTLHLPPQADPRYHCPTLRITDEFLAEPKGPAAQLEEMINTAVAGYMEKMAPRDPSHPYLVNPPRRWRLTSWAAVLDREGNLNPHVHFDGYVSGVYYAQIPGPIGTPEQGEAGWFELGGMPDRFPLKAQPERRTIQPREGMMLLFPSYFYHRTVPFAASAPRISIAFDAMPVV